MEVLRGNSSASLAQASRDIRGRSVMLPFATSASEARRCIQLFREVRTEVGNRQRPRSTHDEDLKAIESLKNLEGAWSSSPPLVFLEIGAFDGLSESNTILLERCLNWTGVLVEANPTAWATLRRSRERSTRVHASPSCATDGVERIYAHAYTSAALASGDIEGTKPVRCVALKALLRHLDLDHVDFFSLDVEGAELKVLSTLFDDEVPDFDVTLIYAEAYNRQCGAECPKRDAVRRLLTSRGYILNPPFLPKVGSSDVFLRGDVANLASAEGRRLDHHHHHHHHLDGVARLRTLLALVVGRDDD
ncbi:hypothetical protein CTAYLR_001140 [Chrysophaeum taylorii]|uniref:Methyltransferase FkbM domain-containing protein n=1 Tax=Chrysophaeum taylorii TaxID=2483200 RepID=A0AAD7UPR7_9STRA|nr:hypothetical protein CTAYLR_001140 [Chrysophaeum taylorii]